MLFARSLGSKGLEMRIEFRAEITARRPYPAEETGTDEEEKPFVGPCHPALKKALEKARKQTETAAKARIIAQGVAAAEKGAITSSAQAATVFASAMRALGVPARVCTGFLLPIYPCDGARAVQWSWAEYRDAGKWHPVDPAAMRKTGRVTPYLDRLPPDRVQLGVGEEIMLEPPQAAGIINLGGVAYAEVAGSAAAVSWEATCADVSEGR